MDNRDVAKEWFLKAENDLITAEILIKNNGPTDIICFHSQQCAEKYLKGFLCFNNVVPPKIHEVEKLIILCGKIDNSFEDIIEIGENLSDYAVEFRYPVYYKISMKDAKDAVKNTKKIKNFVLRKLKNFP